jgi:hypothetical protein
VLRASDTHMSVVGDTHMSEVGMVHHDISVKVLDIAHHHGDYA